MKPHWTKRAVIAYVGSMFLLCWCRWFNEPTTVHFWLVFASGCIVGNQIVVRGLLALAAWSEARFEKEKPNV